MVIKLEQILTQQEVEILIKYAQMNKTVRQLVAFIKSFSNTLTCASDNREVLVNTSDIFYVESVDKKSFVYCEKEVYRTEIRLYQLMEELSDCGFVQISKSCILNINMLVSIRPLLNSRMEAVLKNGETVHVNRKYISAIRLKLQER